jgi:hypothetical protein
LNRSEPDAVTASAVELSVKRLRVRMATSAINTDLRLVRRRRMAVLPLKDSFVLRPAWVEGQGPCAVSDFCILTVGDGLEGSLGPTTAAPAPATRRNESRNPRLLLIAFHRPILRDSCKASTVHHLMVSSRSCSHNRRAWSGDLQRRASGSSTV